MLRGGRPAAGRLLALLAVLIGFAAVARAQNLVVIACAPGSPCTYQRAYSATLSGENAITLVSPTAASDVLRPAKGRSDRLDRLAGLYREPESGVLRVLSPRGELGEIVLPKRPRGAAAGPRASPEWTVQYREQPRAKNYVPVPSDQFVALIRSPTLSRAVVEFVKHEVQAAKPHPWQQQLIAGAVAFAEGTEELRQWREELRGTMSRSLEAFRSEAVDPAGMEATLAAGVATIRIHRLIAADPHQDERLQEDLSKEYRRLLDRFAIAMALKNSEMHDAFLEKLDQIGLARWSRPDLVADVNKALQASAELHHGRALELFNTGQYAGAFDEARLAAGRSRCSDEMDSSYYRARLEFVNKNKVAVLRQYDKENQNLLEQIVRELQSSGQEATPTPERLEYVRKRIADGERLDKDYLPLQLKKAEFLASIGELSASRDVVTHIERTVPLGRPDAEEWLRLDASLTAKLVTLRQSTERQLRELIGSGQFGEALAAAERGLKADPTNARFLYFGAMAAAVLRDQEQAKQLARRHLRLVGSLCAGDDMDPKTLLDLFRRPPIDASSPQAAGKNPNWMSGEFYAPGEASYDPMSGSFNPHILISATIDGSIRAGTDFRWEGFLVTSIQTTTGLTTGERRVVLELEPVYDSKRVYMNGIGTKANSAGQRRVMPLRYLNSPDFDPVLASKFTQNVSTRGWAGNPFFHPFLWNDIYLFDLVYDDLGRIKEANPVRPDVTRPISPFSEQLKFSWEGSTRRLLAITGVRYRREMKYDDRGRLVAEKITYPSGKGTITYKYQGDSMQLTGIECEDNFYDKARRVVHIQPATDWRR